jgi:hypothetical protein
VDIGTESAAYIAAWIEYNQTEQQRQEARDFTNQLMAVQKKPSLCELN